MKIIIQRVSKSSIYVDEKLFSSINKGLNVLLGISTYDNETHIPYLVNKILNMRIFEDANGKMNLSIKDIKGEILLISQFTLYGNCKRGNRPSFTKAMDSTNAKVLYDKFINQLKNNCNLNIKTGVFGAHMNVQIENDGPVTLIVDTA